MNRVQQMRRIILKWISPRKTLIHPRSSLLKYIQYYSYVDMNCASLLNYPTVLSCFVISKPLGELKQHENSGVYLNLNGYSTVPGKTWYGQGIEAHFLLYKVFRLHDIITRRYKCWKKFCKPLYGKQMKKPDTVNDSDDFGDLFKSL